jgi:Kef-type K+ transport system membrane component KefB
MDVSFTNLAVVATVAFAAPLALGLVPGLRLPAVVLEIVLGIVVGPQVLGWAEVDGPVQVMNLIGLAFLLLIAGLEVDFDRLRGRLLRVSGLGFVVSFGTTRDDAPAVPPQSSRPPASASSSPSSS